MDGLAQAIQKMQKAAERAKKISTPSDSKSWDCDICKDVGWVRGEKGMKPCQCYYKKRYETQLKHSGLLKLKEKYRFDTYKTETEIHKQSKEIAMAYTESIKNGGKEWLLASGHTGSGKTHLCSSICFELLDAGDGVVYVRYREIINKLKRNVMSEEYGPEMYRLCNCTILYIDDFFQGEPTRADLNIMFELLDYRYNNDGVTILSTELSLRKLIEIHETIAGRIVEKIGTNQIKFEGKETNYRLFGGK